MAGLNALLCGSTLPAADWPQFLGPERNGVSAETELIDAFPASGPAVVWRRELGTGMSSLAVVDNSAVTMYQDSSQQFVVAMDASTGDIKWKTAVAEAYTNSMGDGPRATPTLHENTVYAFTGQGILCALNLTDGQLLWTADGPGDTFGKPSEYGMASSPLVTGEVVVIQAGGNRGTVAAYNQKSGELSWTVGSGPAGYSSPVLMELLGHLQIVAFCGNAVVGISAADGSELWRYRYETDYDCNTASPVKLSGDTVLISSGENHGSTILKIETSDDTFKAEATWQSLGKDSVLRAEWQTPIVYQDHLFGLDNMGSAGPITNMVCVRIADGKQVWIKPRFGKSNFTLADGKLFVSTMKGELVIVKASIDGFEESSRAQILNKMTRQAPAVANGKLYLRDDHEVVCINVRR